MRSLFAPDVRAGVIDRIRRLTPESPRQWGTLTPGIALAHVADELRQAFGEIPVRSPRRALSYWPLNYLAIHVIPWPKGKGKAAREFATPPSSWDADRATLVGLVERFAAADPTARWPASSVFGALSGRDWGVLCYKHLDHHLRQFGC